MGPTDRKSGKSVTLWKKTIPSWKIRGIIMSLPVTPDLPSKLHRLGTTLGTGYAEEEKTWKRRSLKRDLKDQVSSRSVHRVLVSRTTTPTDPESFSKVRTVEPNLLPLSGRSRRTVPCVPDNGPSTTDPFCMGTGQVEDRTSHESQTKFPSIGLTGPRHRV